MRVTQSMLANNTLRNISSNYSKMSNYMEQLSSGKKISRPSDNPTIAVKAMDYRTQLAEMDQYKRNINEVYHRLDNSDAALDEATKVLQRMRELAVDASNGTRDDIERGFIEKEVEKLKEQLIDIANTNVNGEYLFNGSVKNPPIDNEEIQNDYDPLNINIASGIYMEVSINPEKLFGKDGKDENDKSMFEKIDFFLEALSNEEDNQADLEESIQLMDDNLQLVLDARAELGGKMNRVELIENRLISQELLTTEMKAKNENIDYEEVITKFMSQESVYNAALASSSRLIQQTLMDFLR